MKKVDISELYDVLRERTGCHYIIGDIVGLIPINNISRVAGDLALIEAMNRLHNVAGENDIVFRIGADEFVLLTDSKDMEHINKLAAEIEDRNGETFAYEDKDIPLSLYVLVSTLTKSAHGDSDEMYSQFHSVLNEFKRSIGRPGV